MVPWRYEEQSFVDHRLECTDYHFWDSASAAPPQHRRAHCPDLSIVAVSGPQIGSLNEPVGPSLGLENRRQARESGDHEPGAGYGVRRLD